MTEIERLVLEVESRGLSQVNRDLAKMDQSVKSGEGAWKKMLGAVLAVYGAFKLAEGAINKLISSTTQYQDFNAALKVSTKSAENAAIAYQAIEDFAANTPFSVAEATTAFINLVNLGLNPSERALRAYGNIAASFKASNKTLDDVIQAAADAARGENERLKEFGISASKQGDQISFTFQNVTKTVAFTSKAIEDYLINIGEVNFAGAMSEQMKGLSGTMSNLGDSWDRLWVNISKQGPGNTITQIFLTAANAIDELNARITSGQLEADLKAQGLLWGGYATDIKSSLDLAKSYLSGAINDYAQLWFDSEHDVEDVFGHFPTYAKAAFQVMLVDTSSFVKEFGIVFKGVADSVRQSFDAGVGYAKTAITYIHDLGKNPVYNVQGYKDIVQKYQDDLAKIGQLSDEEAAASKTRLQGELDLNDNIASGVKDDIVEEMRMRNDAFDERKKKAAELRDQYDKDVAARRANKADRLERFQVGGDGSSGTAGAAAAAKKAAEKDAKESEQLMVARLQSVERGLVGENQVISEGYEERKKIILDNEALTQQQKKDLILQALSQSIVSEDDSIKNAYQARRDFILSDTLLTENAKTELMKNLEKNRQAELQKIEQAAMDKRLGQASEFFGNVASIGSTFGKKGFEIAKAAAIAQATIDTYKAATGAYASLASIPYVGPALGAAAAAAAIIAGTARIAQIKSQTYSGAYEHGGSIPAGKYGLVGEAGPEFVRGPAIVTSAATTAAHRTGGGVRSVTIHNNGQPVQATSQMNGEDLMIVLQPLLAQNKAETKREIAGEIGRGGSPITRNLERTYGMRRGQE